MIIVRDSTTCVVSVYNLNHRLNLYDTSASVQPHIQPRPEYPLRNPSLSCPGVEQLTGGNGI